MIRLIIPHLLLILTLLLPILSSGQTITINEVAPANIAYPDEDGDLKDWIELYNASEEAISLEGWSITDDSSQPQKWIFPDLSIAAKEFEVLFASSKDRTSLLTYHTLIQQGDPCKYVLPTFNTSIGWRANQFDDSSWTNGTTGLGYGDGDDNTIVPNGTRAIFLRQTFDIDDPATIAEIILQIDYDDAFAAFINGVEVARANLPNSQGPPAYNVNIATDREATMHEGGVPEKFVIEDAADLLVAGQNVLAIQVHNVSANSSDLSIIPYLSVGATLPLAGEQPPTILALTPPFLHTNFKISEGETLYLFNEAGNLQDSLAMPSLNNGATVGRFPDGTSTIRLFAKTSPAASNASTSYEGITKDTVVFSTTSGFYDNTITLTLSGAEEGETIRYTTNGSEPTFISNSYAVPLTITKNTVVKASIFKPNFLPNTPTTHSYLIGRKHDLPVLSISFNPKDFFDEREGIYTYGSGASQDFPHFGANFWKDREKPVHLDFFEKDRTKGFSTKAGVKIFGGWSRGMDQRSLSLFFRSQYGNNTLKYPLFDTRPYTNYEAFILRNSGNDWQNTMLRDLTLTGLLEDSYVDIQAGRPIVTYLNGEYWGIYNMREKINEHYLAALHTVPTEDITILEKDGDIIFGDNEEYKEMIDFAAANFLAADSKYQVVADQIDLANYIQYQVAQIYFDNTDWPGNNIKFWKHKNGRWRWILFDTDFGFGIWNAQRYVNNTLRFALDSNGPEWPNPPWSTLLFRKMMTNEGFKKRFINTFADELNTRFLSQKVSAKIEANASRIRSEITTHINKWGQTDWGQWSSQVSAMKNFAARRPAIVRDHLKNQFNLPAQRSVIIKIDNPNAGSIQLNSIRLNTANWTGIYFESVPITLTAIPKAGYEFDHWSGNTNATDETITIDPSEIVNLTAHFKASTSNNSEKDIIFNEINYNSSDEKDVEDWVELYNNGTTSQDLSNWVFKDDNDEHSFVIPAGTTLAAKDYLVLSRDTEKLTAQFPNIRNLLGNFDFKLSSEGEFIRLYDAENTLIDSLWFLPDTDWPTAANGEGPTLELINPDSDNTLASSWTTFPFTGTPGAINGVYTTPIFEAPQLAQSIRIAPNPFREALSLEVELDKVSPIRVELLDVTGRYLQALYTAEAYKNGTIQLVLPKLVRGTYWVRVLVGEVSVVKKVVKL